MLDVSYSNRNMKRIKKVERDAVWFLISKLAHY